MMELIGKLIGSSLRSWCPAQHGFVMFPRNQDECHEKDKSVFITPDQETIATSYSRKIIGVVWCVWSWILGFVSV